MIASTAAALLLAGGHALGAEFATESVTVLPLAPPTPYRLYVSDVAIPHIADGKLHIVDGADMKYRGMVSTALAGHAILSPDRRELYVATTYFTKLNRGDRIDQVDVYDAATLKLTAEIAIPPKHAQALPYRGMIRTSSDGRWVFVQNATPATSVSVVDVKARTFVTEVPTPGCWAIYTVASAPDRFSTLCGDGSVVTVVLDAAGKVASQKRAPKFFDPDQDPLFVHGEVMGDTVLFVSFKGKLHAAQLNGDQARFEPPWSLVSDAEAKAGWRPGGYQPFALQLATNRMYVSMHVGGKEGSHKEPAKEIWAFDVARQARVGKVAGSNAIAVAVTRGERPLLFAIDGAKGALVSWDLQQDTPRLRKERMEPIGETSALIEVH